MKLCVAIPVYYSRDTWQTLISLITLTSEDCGALRTNTRGAHWVFLVLERLVAAPRPFRPPQNQINVGNINVESEIKTDLITFPRSNVCSLSLDYSNSLKIL